MLDESSIMYICRQRAAAPYAGSVMRCHAGGSGVGRRDACSREARSGLAVLRRRCERYKPAATSAVLRLAVACATLFALARGASTTGASMRQSVASNSRLLRDACSLPRRRSEATAPCAYLTASSEKKQDGERQRAQPTAAQNAAAGAIAGFTARMAVAPVDLVKIRLQIQQGSPLSNLKYRGMFGTMSTVIKEEGFLALWKGNIPAQVMVMTFVSFKFSAFNACRNGIEKLYSAPPRTTEEAQWRSTTTNLLAGGLNPTP